MNLTEFRNMPLYSFPNPEVEKALQHAVKEEEANTGKTYPLIIGGETVKTDETFASVDPCMTDRVIGKFYKAGKKEAEQAIEAAQKAFNHWRKVNPVERIEIILRAASIARRERNNLTALMSLEIGKNWPEADGEVCRLIDFMEFYARDIFNYTGGEKLPPAISEATEYNYFPLGIGVVISPFNFPYALSASAFVAAIVCGNTVVWKPSSDAAACSHRLHEIFVEAGLPAGVLNLITGSGDEIGGCLVTHPDTSFTAFTGSVEVGTEIYEKAARRHQEQKLMKRVIAEMGGKNAIFVDKDCDVESAVAGVIHSAYGYQGQKCSAASRLILLPENYDLVIDKVAKKAEELTIGPAVENNQLNAVINQKALDKIASFIELGKKEGHLVTGGEINSNKGYYVQPTLFKGIAPDSDFNQQEIFGPVLSVIRADDLDEVLDIVNATRYGLTGAVYSKNPEVIARMKAEWECGNFFVNRGCTGAPAATHPFGGIKLSGTNTRVSGPHYLRNFLQNKFIASRY